MTLALSSIILEIKKMRRKRRLHKPECKAKVAQEAIKGEMTMAQMIKKFEVQQAQITQWKKHLLSNAATAFDSGNKAAEDSEKIVQQLHAKIGQLTIAQSKSDQSAAQGVPVSAQRARYN